MQLFHFVQEAYPELASPKLGVIHDAVWLFETIHLSALVD